jgi:hypothetical protein
MHNMLLAILLATAPQAKVSVSLQAPVDQVAITRTHDQIAASLTPSAKLKLQQLTSSVMSAPIPGDAARLGIRNTFPEANLGDGDIEALAFVVLSEAAASAGNDLKAMADEVKKMNEQKAAIRKQLESAGEKIPPRSAKVQAVSTTVEFFHAPAPLPSNAKVSELRKRFESLSDMAEMNQFMQQTLTDKKLQTEGVLSNSSQKVRDLKLAVVSNLK